MSALAACLIARDAEHTLTGCLQSAAAVVDEVVVYDTGSTDGTREIARSFGATVVEGYWDDDFARARNDALDAVHADWVLSIDADEMCVVDRAAFDRFMAALEGIGLVSVERSDLLPSGAVTRFRTPRLFRRAGAQWLGRVHEWIEAPGGIAHCDPAVLRLTHDGYADEAIAYAKARRNARIGAGEVDQLMRDPLTTQARLARALLDLGRSLIAARDPGNAGQAFDAVRQLVQDDVMWASATDLLARVNLQTRDFGAVRELVAELRGWGAEPQYCDWLLAQALAQSGEPARAAEMLAEIDSLVDPSGHQHDLGTVREFRALALELTTCETRGPRSRMI